MRMQIKHNVYFKNPKFIKEVTHSKLICGKTSNQSKFDFFFISGKISSARLKYCIGQ